MNDTFSVNKEKGGVYCKKHHLVEFIFDNEKGLVCNQCHLDKLLDAGVQVEDLISH